MAKCGLALHTSSPDLGLAIGDLESGDYRSQAWPLGRETSNVLHSYVAKFLLPQAWSDLAWVAAAIGPGGFTGTRLAVVTARTLGQQLQIPVFSISSLAAIAWSQKKEGTIVVTMPAQRGQIFTGMYQVVGSTSLAVVQADRVVTREEWDTFMKTWAGEKIWIEAGANLGDTVDAVWELAQRQWAKGDRPPWQSALPFYGQSPV